MSGPKVMSLDEMRIRQEVEERLNLIQEIYRLDERLKRQFDSCERICDALESVKDSVEANEILKIVRSRQKSIKSIQSEQSSRLSTLGNEELRMYLSKMNTTVQDNDKTIIDANKRSAELKSRYQGVLKECINSLNKIKSQSINAVEIQKKLVSITDNDEARKIAKDLDLLVERIKGIQEEWGTVSHSRSIEELDNYSKNVSAEWRLNNEVIEEYLKKADKFKNDQIKQLLDSIMSSDRENPSMIDGDRNNGIYKRIDVPDQLVEDEYSILLKKLDSLQKRSAKLNIDRKDEIDSIKERIRKTRNEKTWKNYEILGSLRAIDTIQIELIAEEIRKEEIEYDELDSKLSRELASYHAICEEYGQTPHKFTFSKESINAIRYESASITSNNIQKESKKHLAIIRKVLEEKYHYVGEKMEEDHLVNQIYKMPYLNDAYLHVSITASGRMTIEVVAKDDHSRLPLETEVKEILKGQEILCNEYEEIRRKLSDAGVVTKTLKKYDSGEKYARVVDTSGYKEEKDDSFSNDYLYLKSRETKYLKRK